MPAPLLFNGGVHVAEDIAREKNSWRTKLLARGFEVRVVRDGLGAFKNFRALYAKLFFINEPLSCCRLYSGMASRYSYTQPPVAIQWAKLIKSAWKRKIFCGRKKIFVTMAQALSNGYKIELPPVEYSAQDKIKKIR